VTIAKRRVAILGGGMAGLSAAWRLSEPGWTDRFESITVYQRGWRLGGKGASSRGENGRIEEHGLHIWLGSYENAFALLRECYVELDRVNTAPDCPIQTWDQALIPAENPGVVELLSDEWLPWIGTHPRDERQPGALEGPDQEVTALSVAARAVKLIAAFAASVRDAPAGKVTLSGSPIPPNETLQNLQSALSTAWQLIRDPAMTNAHAAGNLDAALHDLRAGVDTEHNPGHRRSWLLVSLMGAVVRGILAHNLVTDPHGFRSIDNEDFIAWTIRHGAHPDIRDYPLIRGLYDLVFGYEDGDASRPAFGAGVMVFLLGQALFEYRGSFFWKMTAGMGDVVIAPLYQGLRERGVKFEFFHRLDALHLDDRRQTIDAITLGRQVQLAAGLRQYEPLTTVNGLPVFPNRPIGEQIEGVGADRSLESHFADRSDVETRTLRRGVDFDQIVLAVSVGMLDLVAGELIKDSREWLEMTQHIKTVATQSFQLWLRPGEAELGWAHPGATISAYKPPFETWASMPQTLSSEQWPVDDTPQTVAYYCGSLNAPWPPEAGMAQYQRHYEQQVLLDATAHVANNLKPFFPNAYGEEGFDWQMLCGVDDERGPAALGTQYLSTNIDPSDRYVQSVPGSNRYRLRPDESGYDNLVLAGDWTDSGLNAGCIEAAVRSGLQAANSVIGRGRNHRIRGFGMP
jgi:uncharacterized protein with NAD-binding domain and iron-sulfur cluster